MDDIGKSIEQPPFIVDLPIKSTKCWGISWDFPKTSFDYPTLSPIGPSHLRRAHPHVCKRLRSKDWGRHAGGSKA